MDEMRIKKTEIEIHRLKRRFDDHDELHAIHDQKLQSVLDWKASIDESVQVNKRMVEVGEGILAALSWVGMAAKWVAAMGAGIAAIWMGIKTIIHMRIW